MLHGILFKEQDLKIHLRVQLHRNWTKENCGVKKKISEKI